MALASDSTPQAPPGLPRQGRDTRNGSVDRIAPNPSRPSRIARYPINNGQSANICGAPPSLILDGPVSSAGWSISTMSPTRAIFHLWRRSRPTSGSSPAAAMPAACGRCSGACPAERPRSASGVKLGRVLINRAVVSAFGQTGHRADIAE